MKLVEVPEILRHEPEAKIFLCLAAHFRSPFWAAHGVPKSVALMSTKVLKRATKIQISSV